MSGEISELKKKGRPFKRKITPEQVELMHKMRKAGEGYKAIAYEIGCSVSSVERWLMKDGRNER